MIWLNGFSQKELSKWKNKTETGLRNERPDIIDTADLTL